MIDEKELVSREHGKKLAEAWARKPRKLTIPDTLLSSSDIRAVVQATGLVSPFYVGGGRKARLKKASYEGRVGSKAYMYKNLNVPERVFNSAVDENLVVPKNSIVFVESDLDFRLPDFIALRFNLQIQHVHRGLLLGTGPLVDPGFWGKLCIPLHNLTDEDYLIPKTEGLFWVEFTKTTLPTDKIDDARVALEADRIDEHGHWEIEKFLDKAATQYTGQKVPIRSSLPTMFGEANAAATKSAADAEAAKENARSALEAADKLRNYNFLSMIGAGVGFVAVTISAAALLFNLSARNEDIADRLKAQAEAAKITVDQHIADVDRYGRQPLEVRTTVPALRDTIRRQQGEIDALRRELRVLKARTDDLQRRAGPTPRSPQEQ